MNIVWLLKFISKHSLNLLDAHRGGEGGLSPSLGPRKRLVFFGRFIKIFDETTYKNIVT